MFSKVKNINKKVLSETVQSQPVNVYVKYVKGFVLSVI